MALNINGTTGISGVDGSASAPAVTGTDSNTGINFASDTVNINTGGSTRATVDSNGRLGVGVTSPNSLFEVNSGSSGDVTVMRIRSNGSAGDTAYMAFDGSANSTRARIGNEIGSGGHGNLVFEVRNESTSNLTESFRIRQDNEILFFQTTTAIPASSGTVGAAIRTTGGAHFSTESSTALNINRNNTGDIQIFQRNGTVKGQININASRTAYETTSDYRLKENITTLSDGITRLKTLKPSRYNFKSDPTNTIDGFLAHELQSVVPMAVSGTKDEVDSENNPVYQGVDTSFLVPLLTAALQEAVAKIEVLETKVAALEAG
mgnify:FL=1|tara:strand:+ start:725 stop:1684 length:960 start_codon:yes stop_codon:yes gene_type:complete